MQFLQEDGDVYFARLKLDYLMFCNSYMSMIFLTQILIFLIVSIPSAYGYLNFVTFGTSYKSD